MNNIDDSKNSTKALKTRLIYFLWLILISCISTLLSILLNNMGIGKENTLMVFLVGVLTVTSITRGYLYGAVASVLSIMLFNYFFTEPFYTFAINKAEDIMLILFFLIASLITSTMTSKLQHQAAIAKRNERTTQLLYNITKGFLNVTGTDNIIEKGINYIHDNLGYECRLKLDSSDNVYFTSGCEANGHHKSHSAYQMPIKGVTNQIGVLEIMNENLPIPAENEMLIKTITYQIALVLDREFIYNEREKIKIAMESEHIKSTLLRSISHDLRTPLTGIIGASELILDSFNDLDSVSVKKLVNDIHEESSWLFKSVQNILDMTLISEGKMKVNKNFEAVDDIINQALVLVPQLSQSGRLHVSAPDEIILIYVDGRLMVHMLINLLDNACKHAGDNAEIFLKTYMDNKNIVFEVSDDGKGIDPSIFDKLFDGFVTSRKSVADGSRGVGLGLAICRAIVSAHKGNITANNLENGGAIFRIVLPQEEI